MNLNKTNFIKELSIKLNIDEEKCTIINDILESNFFISKKSKDKIINELINRLNINEIDANKIYETAKSIVNNEIKNKLKHPFGNQK